MKIHLVSLAFVPARIAVECLKQVYATIGDIEFTHHVLHQHYPLSKDLNDRLLETMFQYYGCKTYDHGRNIGLSAGYNYLIEQCKLKEGDIVIGLDLDCFPTTPKWGEALVKVMQADPTIGWLSLMNQHAARELPERGFTTHTIGGHVCYEGHAPCVQSVIGWSAKSLLGLGGLQEQSQWYGGGEVTNWPRLKALGLKWMYLPEFKEEYNTLMESDGSYRHYKWNLAHLRTTALSFEDWLKESPERINLK
jgi:hypothetical protein